MKEILVTKRDGSKESFDPDKIHKILFWATQGISGVSVSQIETKSQIQLYNGITTNAIHDILIHTASELISEDMPNYQWVSARLRLFQIRKEALGQFAPLPIIDVVEANIKRGFYTSELTEWYTPAEMAELDTIVNHELDLTLTHAGIEQLNGKYLVQNRVTKQVHETPQYLNILVTATLFHKYPKETRMGYIKEFYDFLSNGVISLPTPIMGGLRTKVKQFSSCVKIECADSLDSINAASNAIVSYVSRKAGIGLEAGHIRAEGAEIRGGDSRHTGVQPFYRLFQSAVKSCSQGGIRSGAMTLTAPLWHLEIENILTLKSNKRSEDSAVRHIDYAVQVNGLLYERLLQGKNITLFSPHETMDMHAAFFSDQAEFKRLYEMYEAKAGIMKKTIPAMELFSLFHTQRKETGRIYLMHTDLVNIHSPFIETIAPIKMSNLCMEILLPTKPLVSPLSTEGEIALCTLACINLGKVKTPADMERPMELLVRALNEVLDYQEYPIPAAERATLGRRPLGIGVTNLAYWLAKRGYKYSDDSSIKEWDDLMEAFQYYAIKGSVVCAKERGAACPLFHETKYSLGIMPIDTYKPALDEINKFSPKMDWDWLRNEVKTHGMLNSTLTAMMPVETSSQVIGSMNGIEPIRSLVTVKGSGEGRLKQVVPEIAKLKHKYEKAWDMPNTRGYLNIVAIANRYICQSISASTWYNPENYPNNDVPMSELLRDNLHAYKYGIRTLYYCNTYDGASDEVDTGGDSGCTDGVCKL